MKIKASSGNTATVSLLQSRDGKRAILDLYWKCPPSARDAVEAMRILGKDPEDFLAASDDAARPALIHAYLNGDAA